MMRSAKISSKQSETFLLKGLVQRLTG